MTDTDNGKHELCREVGRRGAVIMQQEQIIALLRAEVKAWREWQRTKCDDNASSLDHWHACKALDAATLETDRTHALDAAGALEES